MSSDVLNQVVADFLIILIAGFAAGLICKRLGVSLIAGYLVLGAMIGEGGLGWVTQDHHELEYLARAGVLLLLFSVGLEFALEELVGLSRYFLVGGLLQMVLVASPLVLAARFGGMPWGAAILVSCGAALSSTVLVFKALAEWGQASSAHGRRAVGILLFQDVALLPLMLVVPFLTGQGETPTIATWTILASKSLFFVAAVIALRRGITHWIVPLVVQLRSVELVVLFSLGVLGTTCAGAYLIGLPPDLGALAAGVMLGGNRLSSQIDTIILPFRESFAAVFFVTLGALLQPGAFLSEPWLLLGLLAAMVLLKSVAAAIALRSTGLSWRVSAGMGLGLSQLGEFSFLLIGQGLTAGVVSAADYNRLLIVALATLIITPQLLKFGLQWIGMDAASTRAVTEAAAPDAAWEQALIVGVGPIGRQIASRLETLGTSVTLIDFSPINLHDFAQQGFRTVAGDARDPEVLHRASVEQCRLAVICVPDDEACTQITRSVRELSPRARIVVRCRFVSTMAAAKKAGADVVVSEEQEASAALLQRCEFSPPT